MIRVAIKTSSFQGRTPQEVSAERRVKEVTAQQETMAMKMIMVAQQELMVTEVTASALLLFRWVVASHARCCCCFVVVVVAVMSLGL